MIGNKKYKRGVRGLIEEDINISKRVDMAVTDDMSDQEVIIEELVIIESEISFEEFKEMLVDI